MITYDDIKLANEQIKTTDIKGKEYAEVNQRIKAFRMCYPEGTIETEMLSNENGICIFRAVVKDIEVVLGTGTAYEKEGSTFINKTSYIENCETSAVGRALGMCGFGIDTSVASFEEVSNAIANQNKASRQDVDYVRQNCTPEQIDKLLAKYKVTTLDDISPQDMTKIILKLNERFTKEPEVKL